MFQKGSVQTGHAVWCYRSWNETNPICPPLTVFTGKAKHKSSEMADVHNLINISGQASRPVLSSDLCPSTFE